MKKQCERAYHISSPWGEKIDKNNPLPEYPRPELIRSDYMSLNGLWDFEITKAKNANQEYDNISCASVSSPATEQFPEVYQHKILVPFAPETSLSGIERKISQDDCLWYHKVVELPDFWKNKRVMLHFEAVDYLCAVFIDGKLVCEHRGGYFPFSVELPSPENSKNTDENCKRKHDIVVAVRDPSDCGYQQRGKQVLDPYGIYYTGTSGIWQTVWLEPVPNDNQILSINYVPGDTLNSIKFLIKTEKPCCTRIYIKNAQSEILFKGIANEAIDITIPNAKLWSPSDPYLYWCKVELVFDQSPSSRIIDTVETYFAFRKIEIAKLFGQSDSEKPFILLNKKPLFLNSPLDQGYWPESGLTPPSEDALLFDIESMKGLGFNGLRKHIKIETRRFYWNCDRLGMLVLQDSVSGGKNRANTIRTGLAMLLGIGAEDKSAFAHAQAGRKTKENRAEYEADLAHMVEHLGSHPSIIGWTIFNESWGQFNTALVVKNFRKHDTSRIIDSVSGWYDQGLGDFRSRHIYFRYPKKAPKSDKRPYFISEFGGYNLSVPGHMWNENERFGYRFFSDKNSLTDAWAALMREGLAPLIDDGLRGAVYTQVSDVEIESNGLYTYDRRVLKIDKEVIKAVNSELYRRFNRLIEKYNNFKCN